MSDCAQPRGPMPDVLYDYPISGNAWKVRTLLRVRLEDALAADRMFTVLMGEHVAPRRRFIETHALEVRNLDI